MKQKLIKKIVKSFDSLIEKTLFKLSHKTNNFFKKGKIVKYFDTLVEKTVLKLENKKDSFFEKKSKISNFNKFTIALISLLFFYLFYLLIPTLYNKTWVQNTIENKLLEDFKINFSISSDITYNILPTPHFLIKNSKIFTDDGVEQKALSEIKNLRVFIEQNNLFNKKKMNIKKILIKDANFSLQEADLISLNTNIDKKFSNKKIKIRNSNIFLKNEKDETIVIVKVPSGSYFYDNTKKVNLLNLDGEIFNSPFSLNINKNFLPLMSKKTNLEVKKLKLNIFNESFKKLNNYTIGKNIISILNTKIQTKYNIKKNLVTFELDNSQIKNSKMNYKGRISIKPFDLRLHIDLKEYNLSKLFNIESIIGELFKSKLLFNENISTNISIDIASNKHTDFFKSSKINLNIINKKINFNQTKLINKKIGILEIDNSDLFFENNKLIFNTDVIFDIQNSNQLFSFLQTPRKLRKKINNIFINLDYDILTRQIKINNLKIDGVDSNDKMMDMIEEFNNSDDYNLNTNTRAFNKLLSAYVG